MSRLILYVRDTRHVLNRGNQVRMAELIELALEQLPPGSDLETILMAMVNVLDDAALSRELMLRTAARLGARERRAKRAGAGLE